VEIKKVLIIRFSSLGDVVLTSAILDPLHKKDGYKIDLLTYKPYGELFKEDPRINNIIQIRREDFRKNFQKLLEILKSSNYYAILDLHANLKSFLLRNLVPARVKVTYRKRSLYRRLCVFLNHLGWAKNLKKKNFNVLEAYAKTLEVLGIKEHQPRPKVLLNKNRTEEVLKSFGLQRGKYIVLGIGARYRKKEYPYFQQLAEYLLRIGKKEKFEVVLVGDKRDYEKSKMWKGVVNLCGKLNLNESLHILKGAKLFIGNDSGATHMARAVGTRVVVIYGGTHPCLGFAPYSDEGVIISKDLPCSPCDIHGKGKCKKNYTCLNIEPETIAVKAFKWF